MTKQEVIKEMKDLQVQIAVLGEEETLAKYFQIEIPDCQPMSLYYNVKTGFAFSCRPITWMEEIDSTDFLEMED